MLHAVIMAGGSGTRFWPASRRSRPKQFLSLIDGTPLIRTTVERILALVPAERIWIVTAGHTASLARELVPEIPGRNILIEPAGRDTAACAGYAATIISLSDPDAVCLVLPADHIIPDAEALRRALGAGAEHVAEENGLLTFGIRPTRPETGYGYLKIGAAATVRHGHQIHVLDRFVEKPDTRTARRYVDSGVYLWNSGMFAWRAETLLGEIARQLPLLDRGLKAIAEAAGTHREARVLQEIYPTLPRTSVDFGIMEGAQRTWTLPVGFAWSDVGSWAALAEVLPADALGNISRGRITMLDATGNIAISGGPVIAAAGVNDLIIIATPDAVLVVPRSEHQRVKEIVTLLGDAGWEDVL
ncbi:MAG: mannose-1-phosphate guanylyltransferase [Acidobacteria bacterium]|nr:mannose-1-phosphate guanylyltransferase [Acidobacteriota bacterium]